MRKQLFRSIPVALAVCAFALTPDLAFADRAHDDHGVYVKIGRGHGFTFGLRHRGYHHHYSEYKKTEYELSEKRERLLGRTRKALREQDFARTQEVLAKLMRVDDKLEQHREQHGNCTHRH